MAKRKDRRDVHGILLLDKRQGVSSNQALQEVRRLFNANKAGHTGSLDPLATGLLPLCFGEATKVSGILLDQDKRYRVLIKLGVMTNTGDAEGEVVAEAEPPFFSPEELRQCLLEFTGEISQVPPMYSALKHQGKKLYELARAGQIVDRPARCVTIFQLNLLGSGQDWLELDVICSKGTYIRSLAEDIGRSLGSFGTVMALRRIASGEFSLDNAHTIEALREMDFASLSNRLIALDAPLTSIPSVEVSDRQGVCIRMGQQIAMESPILGMVRIYRERDFLGLGEMLLNGKLAPRKIFNLDEEQLI